MCILYLDFNESSLKYTPLLQNCIWFVSVTTVEDCHFHYFHNFHKCNGSSDNNIWYCDLSYHFPFPAGWTNLHSYSWICSHLLLRDILYVFIINSWDILKTCISGVVSIKLTFLNLYPATIKEPQKGLQILSNSLKFWNPFAGIDKLQPIHTGVVLTLSLTL